MFTDEVLSLLLETLTVVLSVSQLVSSAQLFSLFMFFYEKETIELVSRWINNLQLRVKRKLYR